MAESELLVLFKGKDVSLSKTAGSVGGSFKKLGGVVTAGAAIGVAALAGLGVGVVGLGSKLIGLGSDAEEMQGKFNVVFANTGDEVTAALDEFAAAVGRSKFELQGMASTFGDTLKPMGFTEEAAATMAVSLSELAVDLGSFNDMETDEALQRLQGTLIGSHENALAFGVIINENTLAAKLNELGLGDLTGAALEQAKVQARIALLMEGTTDAQGDAARTAGSWANQMRALKARLTDTATEIGLKMLPAMTPLLAMVGNLAEQAVPLLTGAFERFLPMLTDASNFVRGFITELQNGVNPVDAILEALLNWTQFGENLSESEFFGIIAFRDKIFELKDAVLDFVTPIAEWVTSFITVKDLLISVGLIIGAVVVNAIIGLLAAIAPVVLAFAALVAVVALIRTAWETDFAGIRDFVASIWEAIQLGVEAFQLLFAGDWEGFLLTIREAWGIAWAAIVEFLSNLWAMVQPKLIAWFEATSTWFQEQDWIALATELINKIVTGLEEFWAETEPKLIAWFEAVTEWYESVDWAELIQNVIDDLVERWGVFWEQAKPKLEKFLEQLTTWVLTTDWKQLGVDIVTTLILGLATFALKVLPTLIAWATAISDWAVSQDWLGIATNIVQGIATAIGGLGYIIVEVISGMVQAAWGAAVSGLGLGGGDTPAPGVQPNILPGVGQSNTTNNTVNMNVNTSNFNAAGEGQALLAALGGI